VEDNATCLLDGESTRRVMLVDHTGSGSLILFAITFKEGKSEDGGGGIFINPGSLVDIHMCVFSNCRAIRASGRIIGGGAIRVANSLTSFVNIYGTSFNGNDASGSGDDIHNFGTITIHNTCPPPYSSNTPTQGKLRESIAR
jgi:hypothetical protein